MNRFIVVGLAVLVSMCLLPQQAKAQSAWSFFQKSDEYHVTVIQDPVSEEEQVRILRVQKVQGAEQGLNFSEGDFWYIDVDFRLKKDTQTITLGFNDFNLFLQGEKEFKVLSPVRATYEDPRGRFFGVESGSMTVQAKVEHLLVYRVAFEFEFGAAEHMNNLNEDQGRETVGPHERVTIKGEAEVRIDVICKRGPEKRVIFDSRDPESHKDSMPAFCARAIGLTDK